MPDRTKKTQKEVAAALTETRGMIYLAADKLQVTSGTVQNYLKRWPKLRELLASFRGVMVDKAERSLLAAIENNEPWAVTYTLNKLAKDRGYVEKSEHDLNINIDRLIESELARVAGTVQTGDAPQAPPDGNALADR